jgi:hypothetical protein
MTPTNAEEEKMERLWRTSARAYGQARRREVCVQWIRHHEHLTGVFRSHADHHAREQERYQRLLAEDT